MCVFVVDYKITANTTTLAALAFGIMGFLDLTTHLFNLLTPALALALLLPLGARMVMPKNAAAPRWWTQIAINLVVGSMVLVLGLWWWGRDGKMATYAALVVTVATCQWVLSRRG